MTENNMDEVLLELRRLARPPHHRRLEREAIEKRQAGARWDAWHASLRHATTGLLRRLVDMHRPVAKWWPDERPYCDYCTSEDGYGRALPRWPCPEIRVIAAEVGVELPPGDDDDEH